MTRYEAKDTISHLTYPRAKSSSLYDAKFEDEQGNVKYSSSTIWKIAGLVPSLTSIFRHEWRPCFDEEADGEEDEDEMANGNEKKPPKKAPATTRTWKVKQHLLATIEWRKKSASVILLFNEDRGNQWHGSRAKEVLLKDFLECWKGRSCCFTYVSEENQRN